MAVFNLGKDINDLQAPKLLPEGWYTLEILDEPKEKLNKTAKDAGISFDMPDWRDALGAADGAGTNIALRLGVKSDNPEHNGRTFFKHMALPNPSDEGVFTQNGQPKADWKIDYIVKWGKAFGGEVAGTTASFEKGQRAQVYISVGQGFSGEPENVLDFNSIPRPLGQGSGGGGSLLL